MTEERERSMGFPKGVDRTVVEQARLYAGVATRADVGRSGKYEKYNDARQQQDATSARGTLVAYLLGDSHVSDDRAEVLSPKRHRAEHADYQVARSAVLCALLEVGLLNEVAPPPPRIASRLFMDEERKTGKVVFMDYRSDARSLTAEVHVAISQEVA